MTRAHFRLWFALLLSLAIHLSPLLARLPSPPPPAPPALAARLVPPPAPAPVSEVPVALPEPVEKAPPKPLPPAPAKSRPQERPVRWEDAVRQQLSKLKAEGLMYSREAIAAGLEGTPVVLAVLDTEGNVTAARIEESSGSALLDRDALSTVRRLRYLPADTPREVVLPIRFRLR